MANWACDPRPHIPKGFELVPHVERLMLRHEVFVIGCFNQYNEDLAIIKLEPAINKEDFDQLATALRSFFKEIHEVHVAEVQPCPFGEAYVRFNSTLERERFLGPVFSFGSYSMRVIKHDEGDNACSFDLDHEEWVMLVGFPEDLKCTTTIAKAVSTFGILVEWHEPGDLARVVAKVYLNEFGKIPNSVKVNVVDGR